MIKRIECTHIHTWRAHTGLPGWMSIVALDGVDLLTMTQRGDGEPATISAPPGGGALDLDLVKALERSARSLTGLPARALEVVIAGMNPGDRGEDGLMSFEIMTQGEG